MIGQAVIVPVMPTHIKIRPNVLKFASQFWDPAPALKITGYLFFYTFIKSTAWELRVVANAHN